MRDKVATAITAGIAVVADADAVRHKITGDPCDFGLPGGEEIAAEPKLHPPEGDYGELSVLDDDGAPHPINTTGPVTWHYPDLFSLCAHLSRSLYLFNVGYYQVHSWARTPAISVVTTRGAFQAGGPIYLRHPVWELELALAVIKAERRYDRMLAFAGQARGET